MWGTAKVAAAVLAAGTASLWWAAPAGAEVDGPCQGTVNGQDIGPLSSSDPDDAIDLDADSVVTVGASAAAPISSYQIEMEFAGFSWQVAEGEANDTSWQREVEVADYARFGVGLYEVRGISDGVDCSGAVLVKITGRNPLTTVAGASAAVLAVGAGVGVVQSLRRARDIGGVLSGSDGAGGDAGTGARKAVSA